MKKFILKLLQPVIEILPFNNGTKVGDLLRKINKDAFYALGWVGILVIVLFNIFYDTLKSRNYVCEIDPDIKGRLICVPLVTEYTNGYKFIAGDKEYSVNKSDRLFIQRIRH